MKRQKRNSPSSTRISARAQTTITKPVNMVSKKPKNKWLMGFWIFIAVFTIAFFGYLYNLSTQLPPLTQLEQIDPDMASQVYSVDGERIHSFFTYNRSFTPFEKIPPGAIDALLATEDRDFYNHWGINLSGIARALFVDIISFDIVQGASTLTMQLARNLYFDYAQRIDRKIKEAMTAIQIERTYSKNEILDMYLNINFFGNHAYGIKAAAQRYFDKEVEDLEVQEAAMIIGLLKGPTYYSPIRYPERALKRRNVVLLSMFTNDNLSEAEFDSLKQIPLNLTVTNPFETNSAPYFTEYIRQQMEKLQDSLNVNVYKDGLRIYTSLNIKMQQYMDEAVERQLPAIQKRVRNQAAFRNLKKTLSDSAFNELTMMQMAFVALDPHNGHILAMIGGRNFEKSKWNHVTQMARQPGSAFKPFLYTAAIDNGYTAADQYQDIPTVEFGSDGERWKPKNYSGTFSSKMIPLREALQQSLNSVAVRLISDITPKVVIQYAKAMGITSPLRPFSSLALGSSEVIPLELISAFGIFANNGLHVKPVSILRIEDKNGIVIYEAHPSPKEVLSPETTHIMNGLLQNVVNRGTGVSVRTRFKFHKPAGGKTGTTNDFSDAWFVGFTPDIVAGVWVGLEDFQYPLGPGMAGSVAALPFWGDFMKTVYDSLEIKQGNFSKSINVVKLKICDETKKLATPYCPKTYEETFNVKYKPSSTCDMHTGPQQFKRSRRKRF